MTPEDDAILRRIFPGDPVPDVDDGVVWVQRESVTRGPRLAAYTRAREVESHRVMPEFQRLMEREPPQPVVSVPERQYLLESDANVTRWLDEAREIESDVKLGQPAQPHRVTRLMLEAIPVVEKFKT